MKDSLPLPDREKAAQNQTWCWHLAKITKNSSAGGGLRSMSVLFLLMKYFLSGLRF